MAFIYKVTFVDCPLDGLTDKEFYFTSLSAIYDVFTPEQIGCKVSRLWNIGVTRGTPYTGRLTTITRVCLTRKQNCRTRAVRRSNEE